MTVSVYPSASEKIHPSLGRAIDIAAAFRTEPPPLDWTLPGLVSGTVGVLVAPGGIGKSMLMLQTAMSIAAGRDLFAIWGSGGAATPIMRGPVLIVAAEDTRDVLERRLHDIGKELSPEDQAAVCARLRLHVSHGRRFSLAQQSPDGLAETEAVRELENCIEAMPEKPRLIVIDTLNRCLGSANENTAADMGFVLSVVERICGRYGCAALIVHHATKSSATSGGGQAQSASRGSSAITDNARCQFNLSTLSRDQARDFQITCDVEMKSWVRLDLTKANYCAPRATSWLHRGENGVLRGAPFPAPQALPTGKARGARAALAAPTAANDNAVWE